MNMDRPVIRGEAERQGRIYLVKSTIKSAQCEQCQKKGPLFLTAEAGKGYRGIKKPTELVEPARAAPPIIRHVRREAYGSTRVWIPPQEGTQRVYEL